jgi:hypothetical protein
MMNTEQVNKLVNRSEIHQAESEMQRELFSEENGVERHRFKAHPPTDTVSENAATPTQALPQGSSQWSQAMPEPEASERWAKFSNMADRTPLRWLSVPSTRWFYAHLTSAWSSLLVTGLLLLLLLLCSLSLSSCFLLVVLGPGCVGPHLSPGSWVRLRDPQVAGSWVRLRDPQQAHRSSISPLDETCFPNGRTLPTRTPGTWRS